MALTPDEELELLELEEEEYQFQKKSKPQNVDTKKDVSMLDSATRGYAQGSTLGFADEIGGAIGAGIDKIAGLFGDSPTEVSAKLAEQGFKGDIGPTDFKGAYKQSRNEQRQDDLAAQEANPWTYGLSNVAGSMALPGLNAAKGASAVKAGLMGAGSGALQGAGNTEDIASMKALEDILTGAAFGGVSSAAMQGASNYIGKIKSDDVADSLKEIAENQSARALGAERGTIKSLGMDKVRDIGRYGLDNKIVTPLANTDDLITRNEAALNKAGGRMGDIFSKIDESKASTFNPKVAATRMENELGGFYRDPINKGETNQFDNIIESITNRGVNDIPIAEAQALKEKIGKVANWKNNLNVTDKERMARDAYGLINNYLDESVDVASDLMEQNSGAGFKDALKEARRQYSGGKGAEKLLENKQAREQGNKMFGLTDTILGAGGVAAAPYTGGLSAAPIALVGGKKLLEKYGSQTAAVGFDKLGDMVKRNPNMFGKFSGVLNQAASRGKNALGATHFILQQQNPEYREQLKALEEEQNNE